MSLAITVIMNPRVCEALENTYRVFAGPKPQRIDACPCCVDDTEICVLLSKRLRDICAEELSGYASSVFLTAGAAADFRYFLPRILEICLSDWSWWPDIEVVMRKLSLAGWQSWAPSEINVLMSVFETGFDEAIEASSSEDLHREVDSWICGLGLAGVDLRPFLAKLEAPAAANALIRFFDTNEESLRKGTLTNAFWEEHEGVAAQVIGWFNSTNVQTAIQRGRQSLGG